MSDNNSVPAFPCRSIPLDPDTYMNHPGMTLRDYFAAKAMQGFCTSINQDTTWDQDAATAYRVANAMLKARES